MSHHRAFALVHRHAAGSDSFIFSFVDVFQLLWTNLSQDFWVLFLSTFAFCVASRFVFVALLFTCDAGGGATQQLLQQLNNEAWADVEWFKQSETSASIVVYFGLHGNSNEFLSPCVSLQHGPRPRHNIVLVTPRVDAFWRGLSIRYACDAQRRPF